VLCAAECREWVTLVSRRRPPPGWVSAFARTWTTAGEVYAAGAEAKLAELAGMLYRGPRWPTCAGLKNRNAPCKNWVRSALRLDADLKKLIREVPIFPTRHPVL